MSAKADNRTRQPQNLFWGQKPMDLRKRSIDFTMHVEKEEDPKGDRVKLTLSGKFLPYKKW